MAGAIAGTAILHAPNAGSSCPLDTIALTINNRCNLECPHCYLQYRERSGLPAAEVLAAVMAAPFRHLAIVGKEPLVDRESAVLCEFLARECEGSGRSVSLITNGHGLARIEPETAQLFAFIDLSLDGGPRTYKAYRGGAFSKIFENVGRLARSGFRRFNALHVLNELTISNVSDMLDLEPLDAFETIAFQPYVVTRNDGLNPVGPVPLSVILRTLASNSAFRDEGRSCLIVDTQHLQQDGLSHEEFLNLIDRFDLSAKVRYFPADPLEHGFLRVTYDGYVLSPLDSLHPADYRRLAAARVGPKLQVDLAALFGDILARGTGSCVPM